MLCKFITMYCRSSFSGIIVHLTYCYNTLSGLSSGGCTALFIADSNFLRPRKIEGAVKFLVFQTLQQNYKSPWLSSFKLNREDLDQVGLSVNTSKLLAAGISHCHQASHMSLVADRIAHV